jgi:hypothetical protein
MVNVVGFAARTVSATGPIRCWCASAMDSGPAATTATQSNVQQKCNGNSIVLCMLDQQKFTSVVGQLLWSEVGDDERMTVFFIVANAQTRATRQAPCRSAQRCVLSYTCSPNISHHVPVPQTIRCEMGRRFHSCRGIGICTPTNEKMRRIFGQSVVRMTLKTFGMPKSMSKDIQHLILLNETSRKLVRFI